MILYDNFVHVVGRYADFSGRASRSEFWWYALALVIVALFVGVPYLLLSSIPYAPTVLLYAFILAILTPSAAVTVRRLHDTGRSAWWLLGYAPSVLFDLGSFVDDTALDTVIWIVGIIGRICTFGMLVLMIFPSDEGGNRYGADPR